jgi:hypothetical protein
MVVIVDPHLKRSPDYPVYKQAVKVNTKVGVGVAAALGQTFSTLLLGTGGRLCSKSTKSMDNGLGRRARPMFTSGTI